MNKKLVIANWKMNPTSAKEAKKIFTGTKKEVAKTKGAQVVVCPPAVFLADVAKEKQSTKVQLGVQDLFYEESGAFTGQTSPAMAQGYKAKWAILGHSERRARGEDNELVGRKVRYTIQQGMTAVLCVGEQVRTDEGDFYNFIRDELEAVFAGLKRKELAQLVVAYEPIWAIGKRAEEACSTAQLMEMSLFIRKQFIERFGRKPSDQLRVLYGGSVKPDNAAELVRDGGIDGLLVGGASLVPAQFGEIVRTIVS